MSKTLINKMFAKQRLYSLKMQEGFDLIQHGNIFNNIITDLVRLQAKIDDEDKETGSYDPLVATFTYKKNIIILDVIIITL